MPRSQEIDIFVQNTYFQRQPCVYRYTRKTWDYILFISPVFLPKNHFQQTLWYHCWINQGSKYVEKKKSHILSPVSKKYSLFLSSPKADSAGRISGKVTFGDRAILGAVLIWSLRKVFPTQQDVIAAIAGDMWASSLSFPTSLRFSIPTTLKAASLRINQSILSGL